MLKIVALLGLLGAAGAQQVLCRVATSPALNNSCPGGYTKISNGECCPSDQCYTGGATCEDQKNAQGVNECPGMKGYCNNSIYKQMMKEQCPKTCGYCTGGGSCVDLTNPNTGRSDCAGNVNLCNNSIYREMMKTQCPKTCGYC